MFSSSGDTQEYAPSVIFTLTASLHDDFEAEDFVQSIFGKILMRSDKSEQEVQAGYINASLVQFGNALDHGIHPERIGDGLSGDLAEYWERLFDAETGYWQEPLQD